MERLQITSADGPGVRNILPQPHMLSNDSRKVLKMSVNTGVISSVQCLGVEGDMRSGPGALRGLVT